MNTLCAEAAAAAALALRIYHPAVGRVVRDELGWRGQISWGGDPRTLRALIEGVRRDAVRLREHDLVTVAADLPG
jgi:hypothetical protein